MEKKNENISAFGIIGSYNNLLIEYNKGLNNMPNYLKYNKKNYSVNPKFEPLTISKAIKIIEFKNKNKKELTNNKKIQEYDFID
jgi:hypothetical protein